MHPKLLVTFSVIVFVPEVLYITPVGFCEVEVAGEAPVPKSHEYVIPAPLLPVLVKFTAVFVQTGALLVNEATGDGLIVTA